MIFDVYCDESRPDLLSSKNPQAKYMLIGSLWLAHEKRDAFKKEIHAIRNKHSIGGEFKWQKVSPSKLSFYKELIAWFYNVGSILRYRCIVVEHEQVDLKIYHNSDQELGFYKFYYQLLKHWIYDCNEYNVFVDCKITRNRDSLIDLHRCLSLSNLSSKVNRVQAIPSREPVLMQLTDVLTGIASYKLNENTRPNCAKFDLLCEMEKLLGNQLKPTSKNEQKYNIFKINLSGGW